MAWMVEQSTAPFRVLSLMRACVAGKPLSKGGLPAEWRGRAGAFASPVLNNLRDFRTPGLNGRRLPTPRIIQRFMSAIILYSKRQGL